MPLPGRVGFLIKGIQRTPRPEALGIADVELALGRGDGGYGFKVGSSAENWGHPDPSELEDEFRSLVMAGLPEKPPTHIRVAYQQWAVGHSISRFLEPLQPGFFAWLDAR
jgi:hypothetical protein